MDGQVLVIGAGVAGMKASLLLASAGRKVHLVEKSSSTGGRLVRCEDIFPAMECATCMVSPMQQEVLRNGLIKVTLLGRVISVKGSRGDFTVRIRQRASSVDPEACIGCAECWNACPVRVRNRFEEGMSERSAISVPCAGALPNVPWIDRKACLRWTEGKECSLCADACVFAAIDFFEEDSEIEETVSDIILATGYGTSATGPVEHPEPGSSPAVFTAPEFERCYASNGPTSGELLNREGITPASAAIVVHAGGIGEHSPVSTMYSLKFLHYLKEKIPAIRPLVILDGTYDPDPAFDPHHHLWKWVEADVVPHSGPVETRRGRNGSVEISCDTGQDSFSGEVDLLVLGTRIVPSEGTVAMAELLGLDTDDNGFVSIPRPEASSVTTSVPGVFAAGCASGPAGIADSVTSASAAVARVLAGAINGE